MKIKILCFGITKDIVGDFESIIDIENGSTVAMLKSKLETEYPQFARLTSLRIAVNEEYGNETQILTERDEIVLIPPVSGG